HRLYGGDRAALELGGVAGGVAARLPRISRALRRGDDSPSQYLCRTRAARLGFAAIGARGDGGIPPPVPEPRGPLADFGVAARDPDRRRACGCHGAGRRLRRMDGAKRNPEAVCQCRAGRDPDWCAARVLPALAKPDGSHRDGKPFHPGGFRARDRPGDCRMVRNIAAEGGMNLAARLGVEKAAILHVDDLAMCHGGNRAYLELAAKRAVTCGSVMVPCPWFREIAEAAAADPALDLGVHLTLTSEWAQYRWRPLSTTSRTSGLIDRDGYFWRDVASLRAHLVPEAAETELRAQIEYAIAAGMQPSH